MWIGLTGGIASGKSQVSSLLKSKGYPVIDADEITRNLSQKNTPAYRQIVSLFGPGILDDNQDLDRVKLGKIVFSDRGKLEQLENILHPLVRKEVERQKQNYFNQGKQHVFYDVPLLFEKNLQKDFDWIVLVSTSPENQLQRIIKRNQLTPDQAQLRIQAQRPLKEKIPLAHWVIDNNGNLDDLTKEVEKLLSHLEAL